MDVRGNCAWFDQAAWAEALHLREQVCTIIIIVFDGVGCRIIHTEKTRYTSNFEFSVLIVLRTRFNFDVSYFEIIDTGTKGSCCKGKG